MRGPWLPSRVLLLAVAAGCGGPSHPGNAPVQGGQGGQDGQPPADAGTAPIDVVAPSMAEPEQPAPAPTWPRGPMPMALEPGLDGPFHDFTGRRVLLGQTVAYVGDARGVEALRIADGVSLWRNKDADGVLVELPRMVVAWSDAPVLIDKRTGRTLKSWRRSPRPAPAKATASSIRVPPSRYGISTARDFRWEVNGDEVHVAEITTRSQGTGIPGRINSAQSVRQWRVDSRRRTATELKADSALPPLPYPPINHGMDQCVDSICSIRYVDDFIVLEKKTSDGRVVDTVRVGPKSEGGMSRPDGEVGRWLAIYKRAAASYPATWRLYDTTTLKHVRTLPDPVDDNFVIRGKRLLSHDPRTDGTFVVATDLDSGKVVWQRRLD